MAVIFCFDTSSEDKETRILDEKDINFQKSVTQTPTSQNLRITNYDKFASNNGGKILLILGVKTCETHQ